MRSRWISATMAAAAMLAWSSLVVAQNGQQGKQKGKTLVVSNEPFDPHDISGFWDMTNIGRPPGALNETSNNRPPMTPWGLEKFHKAKTGYDGKQLSNGVFPDEKDWNDPILWCDPTGFPRIMWHPTTPGMRLAQADEEVIQFFENNRVWRDLWTDGRKLPGDEADPRWYGYAVGHWEGDTFVVNSNNYEEASWLDQYGSPHSDQLTVEERYRRIDHDHLEMIINITDPKTYVGTWKGDKKIFQLVTKPARSQYADLREDICAWSEVKSFFDRMEFNGKGGLQIHQ
jgi:hypothetical protein